MNFFTGIHNILYLYLSSTILRDTYFSMTGSAKHVSSLPTFFRTKYGANSIYIVLQLLWNDHPAF